MTSQKQIGQIAKRVVDEQRKRQLDPEKFAPLKTGLQDLDRVLRGYNPKWYLCVGGEAKTGKTTMVQHLSTVIAAAGHSVWYVPLEERETQIAIRSLARLSTKVRRSDFRTLSITDEGFDELDMHVHQLEEIQLYIQDTTLFAAKLFELVKNANPRPEVICIDYTQLFQDFPGRSMAERSDAISAFFMRMRNELDVGLIVAFQLGVGGKRMYGGTSVYRDADVILHISQKKDQVTLTNMESVLEVTIMPSRDVAQAKIEVLFSGAHSRITDVIPTTAAFLLDEKQEVPDEFIYIVQEEEKRGHIYTPDVHPSG